MAVNFRTKRQRDMGCGSSRTVASAVADVHDSSDGRQASSPIPSVFSTSTGTPMVPSIPVEHPDSPRLDTPSGALSARSIGFNETYTPIKLLGKGSFGKVC